MAYASADGVTLLTRVHRPAAGTGLGHAIVMVHGGAWTMNDRITPEVVCSELARRGLVVFSLDFRHGPDFKHPSASCDIAAGVRFVRLHAADFDVDPDTIGLIGSSSGGHLVLLTGIKPDVPVHRGTRVADLDGGFVDPVEVSAAGAMSSRCGPYPIRCADSATRRKAVGLSWPMRTSTITPTKRRCAKPACNVR